MVKISVFSIRIFFEFEIQCHFTENIFILFRKPVIKTKRLFKCFTRTIIYMCIKIKKNYLKNFESYNTKIRELNIIVEINK